MDTFKPIAQLGDAILRKTAQSIQANALQAIDPLIVDILKILEAR